MTVRNLHFVEKGSGILKFPKENIVDQPIEQVNRSLQVKREFFLHHLGRENMKIYFLDHTGLKKVEVTHWAVTEKAIVLKESIIIPLANIIAVA